MPNYNDYCILIGGEYQYIFYFVYLSSASTIIVVLDERKKEKGNKTKE